MRSLALLLLLPACTAPDVAPGDTDDAPSGDDTAGDDPAVPVEWSRCQRTLDCASIEVPYDRDDPSLGTFPMAIARAEHTGPERAGVLVFNPGGPGQDGTPLVSMIAAMFPDVNESWDIVGFDPRGGGTAPDSEPLGCALDPAQMDAVYARFDGSTDIADLEAVIEAQTAVFDACRATNPVLVDHMGMNAWADDLDAIREALGVETISYYGASAGTALGLTYGERYPERVDRVVLDSSISAHGGAWWVNNAQLDGFPRFTEYWAEWCTGETSCSVADDPMGAMEAVLEQGRVAPLLVDGRPLTWGRVAYGITAYLYSERSWGVLDDVLAETLAGDGDRLMAASDSATGRLDDEYMPLMLIYYHTLCSDNTMPATPADIAAWVEATTTEGLPTGELPMLEMTWCAAFGAARNPVAHAATGEGAPPYLMLQSTEDLAAPMSGALEVKAGLTNGTVMLVREGYDHVVASASECARDAAAAFFLDGTLPADGTRCED